jgi:hypothetical protein
LRSAYDEDPVRPGEMVVMKARDEKKDINRIFVDEPHLIDEALRQGVRDAMLRHKRAGLPVVIWRDGHSVWVKPEDLGF